MWKQNWRILDIFLFFKSSFRIYDTNKYAKLALHRHQYKVIMAILMLFHWRKVNIQFWSSWQRVSLNTLIIQPVNLVHPPLCPFIPFLLAIAWPLITLNISSKLKRAKQTNNHAISWNNFIHKRFQVNLCQMYTSWPIFTTLFFYLQYGYTGTFTYCFPFVWTVNTVYISITKSSTMYTL